jgi:DNA-directed RNA polymerase subunit M/transcription elongation factor TFIIS
MQSRPGWQEVMAMREMRRCPRCSGMLFVETYLGNEADLVCVQCGYRRPLETPPFYDRRSRRQEGQPARRAA